uniref:Uncharacterized protein n=1 Tax=Steinernema glaseri TaxID=37863 RepID=A0A1I8A0L9_9BILA
MSPSLSHWDTALESLADATVAWRTLIVHTFLSRANLRKWWSQIRTIGNKRIFRSYKSPSHDLWLVECSVSNSGFLSHRQQHHTPTSVVQTDHNSAYHNKCFPRWTLHRPVMLLFGLGDQQLRNRLAFRSRC